MNEPVDAFSRLTVLLQVDRPLAYALLAKVWQAFSGPISLLFIIGKLEPREQGVYYSLSTVMGIQLFFELGLSTILVSQSANMFGAISSSGKGFVYEGSSEIGQLISSSRKWYLFVSFVFLLAAIVLGHVVLQQSQGWQLPLIVLSVLAACTVAIVPDLAVLEGSGYREPVYKMRFIQIAIGAAAIWFSLSLGLKLWALVASTAVQLICSLYLTRVACRSFFTKHLYALRIQRSYAQEAILSWGKEVLPLQWRVALVSVVYHAATQFFTVILLSFHGDIAAGRLGMSLSVTSAIQGMALAWVFTQFSVVANLHGAGKREEAGTAWRNMAVRSTLLLLFMLSSFILVLSLLPYLPGRIDLRFIRPFDLLILSLGCIANHLIAIQSFYVLSRKGLPFVVPSLFGFSCTGLAVWIGGVWYATPGIVWGYMLTMAFIVLPLHSFAYLAFRRRI